MDTHAHPYTHTSTHTCIVYMIRICRCEFQLCVWFARLANICMLLPFRCNFVGFFYELELELGLGLRLWLRLRLGAYEYSDELDEHSYSRRRQREREIERKSLSFAGWRGEGRWSRILYDNWVQRWRRWPRRRFEAIRNDFVGSRI